jgi:hypothetical protein
MTNPMTAAAANLDASIDRLAALRAAGHEARNTKTWRTAMYNHSVYVLRGKQFGLCI